MFALDVVVLTPPVMPTRAVLLVLTTLLSALISATSFAQRLVRVDAINSPRPNFELCLGLTLDPQATFHSVSSVPHRLRLQLTIRNEVTGIKVYGDTVIVEDLATGQPIVQNFKTFVTNPNILSQLGRFRLSAIVNILDANGDVVEGSDVSDTMWINMFGLRRTAPPFGDASNGYSVIHRDLGGGALPDQHKWVSIGATAVDGAQQTFDPLSPRDYEIDTFASGPLKFKAPAIKLDRRNTQGTRYSGVGVGDTLVSFAINMKGMTETDLTFSYHRSIRRQYPFGYDMDTLYGPESTIMNADGNVSRVGDSLVLEFRHPDDSACGYQGARWIRIGAIDGGKDLEWQQFLLNIDTAKFGRNYFTQNFRFRLRLAAKSDTVGSSIDDEDEWFVDNLSLWRPGHPEYSMKWVRVVSPYNRLPSSQAILPINVSSSMLPSRFYPDDRPVFVRIKDSSGKTVFFATDTVFFLGKKDTVSHVAEWDTRNASLANGNRFTVTAWIGDGSDYNDDDNLAQCTFSLNVVRDVDSTQEFALDDGTNDYPELTNRKGAGVGFSNTSGSYAMRFKLVRPDSLFGARVYFASGNSGPDPIRIAIHRGSDTSDVPGEVIEGATLLSDRMGEQFDKFWTYRFAAPVEAPSGDYWLSVSQLGLDNMAIGADISRSGFDMTVSGPSPQYQYIHRSPYGTQYDSVSNSGDISRAIAFEVPAGSGNWKPFTPEAGMSTNSGFAWAGTYIPMIRPLVGNGTPLASVRSDDKSTSISAYPNPFVAGQDVVKFGSAIDRSATISNLLGQHVRTLSSSTYEWDGKDGDGKVVSPGVYIVNIDESEPILLIAR
jgi:hypothetical protein